MEWLTHWDLRKESEIVGHFQAIISELGEGPFDSFLEANFLVFSGVFGVLRRWILKPRYNRKEIIDFLVQSQIRRLTERIGKRKPLLKELRRGRWNSERRLLDHKQRHKAQE